MQFRSKEQGNLTEADRKFFALRESGYKGPVDQDGNKAESGKAAEVLKGLRDRT